VEIRFKASFKRDIKRIQDRAVLNGISQPSDVWPQRVGLIRTAAVNPLVRHRHGWLCSGLSLIGLGKVII